MEYKWNEVQEGMSVETVRKEHKEEGTLERGDTGRKVRLHEKEETPSNLLEQIALKVPARCGVTFANVRHFHEAEVHNFWPKL